MEIKNKVAYIKKTRQCLFGWASFKHHLIELGVIPDFHTDVPVEWQEAYKRAHGR